MDINRAKYQKIGQERLQGKDNSERQQEAIEVLFWYRVKILTGSPKTVENSAAA